MLKSFFSRVGRFFQGLRKRLIRGVLRLLYRVEVHGLEHLQGRNERVLVAANHQSFLDGPLLYAFLPGQKIFTLSEQIAHKWWVRLGCALGGVKTFNIDLTSPFGIRHFIKYMKEHTDESPVIFPEGRLSVTGTLMKIYDGPALVADKTDTEVLTVRIKGTEHAKMSGMIDKVRTRWFPKIELHIMPPQKLQASDDLLGRRRRQVLGRQLYDAMTEMMFRSSNYQRTLPEVLNERIHLAGRSKKILIEARNREHWSYGKLRMTARILGGHMAQKTRPDENVGLLLPTSCATVAAFFGLLSHRRVPVMLNVTAGEKNLLHSARVAQLKCIYTSREFVEKAKAQKTLNKLGESVKIEYLEDLKQNISMGAKISGFLKSFWPLPTPGKPDDPAVILFTSGTEGMPKGVVLSHANILSNLAQVHAIVDLNPGDRVFNALPAFHSFGLVAGTLLPLLMGVQTALYPTPLHFRVVPELIYLLDATVTFGTDTFLAHYGRFAHPYNFRSLRYVFAGAEKLKEETRRNWMDKFGVRILEGYGITETSPILSGNTLAFNKPGSVGRLVPGLEYRLKPFEGVDEEEGGRLVVKGPNIMKGYLDPDNPGGLLPPQTEEDGPGWYDTGDVVRLDERGFVEIVDRAKRFAKVSGEMIPLVTVETFVGKVWPKATHAVVALPDERRGEKLVLATEKREPDRQELKRKAQEEGMSELWVPKEVRYMSKLPRLSTGKVDFKAIRQEFEEEKQGSKDQSQDSQLQDSEHQESKSQESKKQREGAVPS